VTKVKGEAHRSVNKESPRATEKRPVTVSRKEETIFGRVDDAVERGGGLDDTLAGRGQEECATGLICGNGLDSQLVYSRYTVRHYREVALLYS